ncbi:DUF362 domain-containing protein [candidate division WOR-3 bacterium]|nr:DUF362 domain-containing protein [candidate division WOR-3 bacterium]
MVKKILVGTLTIVSITLGVSFPLVLDPTEPAIGETWQESSEPAVETQVSIVQSTNSSLTHPISLDQEPSADEVEEMVRLAVDLVGGMDKYVSGCSLVVIKPNIVELMPSGSGVITDAKVIRAIAKLVFEANPETHVVIGEAAGGWCPDSSLSCHPSVPVGDGFEVADYWQILEDPVFESKNIEIIDLNLEQSEEMPVDSPYYASSSYFLPQTLLRASCVINAPVMKVHVTGITGALKNNIGVLPGLVYGWWKAVGYPYPDPITSGLKHTRDLWDEEITDISSVMESKIKLTVVDAVVCREKNKGPDGLPKRRNMIVAGEDMVAVDWTLAQLMGMNPDDIEHITLAGIKGLGTNNGNLIEVLGNSISEAKAEFIKDPREDGTFGQSNRIWILSGPYSGTDIDYDNLGGEAAIMPEPGIGGWTQPLYFFDDYINLTTLTPDADQTVYAHTYFYSPRSGPAELWIGSDEDIKVFLNGAEVYRFSGSRTHGLPNEIVPISIQQGRNRLLVKAVQVQGSFDFCLNICEPDTREEYHGNRVFGLKFYPDSTLSFVAEERRFRECFVYVAPNPARREVPFQIYVRGQNKVELKIVDAQGRLVEHKLWNQTSPMIYWTWRPEGKLPAGIYFYQIQTGDPHAQEMKGKIVLLK